ncbi:NtaA/DmoA family FMN-dependent monooxygenase [Streptomyces sp. NPDC004546]|uniref:NtaA/DmoA family FMN-dependent monooxygenase n=1 Tax=Streptomyces sp. NPDC004546 TaxID=3154282 RepID=UPI0033AF20D6
MAEETRYLSLNLYVRNSGYHEASWRISSADPAAALDPRYYVDLARVAERGVLDSVFLPDSPGMVRFRSAHLPSTGLDPVQLLSAVAQSTTHIGLVATVSTTYTQPWETARRLATLDFLSQGRAGWNIVTTAEPEVARNFGNLPHPPHAQRYERAQEYVDVVLKLFDGWSDTAAVMSRADGVWADTTQITSPHHHGRHFDVEGPLPLPRSPQGRPYLTQAGASPAGMELAARYADAVFTPQRDVPSAVAFRGRLREMTAQFGRSADHFKVLPGLPFLLGSTDAEAKALHTELEDASSDEFRWRNTAHLAGLDHTTVDPDAPLPDHILDAQPLTSFGGSIYQLAKQAPAPFREVARRVSALPGALDFIGTPEGLADLITDWWRAGASDGFTLMPNLLPDQVDLFVGHVVPILQRRGIARREYRGSTLRDHAGLPWSTHPHNQKPTMQQPRLAPGRGSAGVER